MTAATGQGARLEIIALPGIADVKVGDNITSLILDALINNTMALVAGDIVVIAQKVISKSEGRKVVLGDVTPGPEALKLAEQTGKDPCLVELILAESEHVLRYREGLIIVEHKLGLVNATAGIDCSNVGPGDEGEAVLLLPEDPDANAKQIRQDIMARTGWDVGVIINDTMGRAWRRGVVGHAIGCAGVAVVQDLVGHRDLYGRELMATEVAVADELAAAASLVMGQSDQGRPVVVIRGAGDLVGGTDASAELIRPREMDLFR